MVSFPLLCEVCSGLTSALLFVPLPCVGPGDVDANSIVGAADWALMAPCVAGADVATPPAGCTLETFEYADVERDGDVDLRDAAAFQNVYSDDYFDYGPYLEDKEAEWIAVHFTDGLKASVPFYERVRHDLLTIRTQFPQFEETYYSGRFLSRVLTVVPVNGEWGDVLQELTRYYQAEFVCHPHGSCTTWYLTFCDSLNMEAMAAIWQALPEVESAQTSGPIDLAICPDSSLWVDWPYDFLRYNFWCCGHGSYWRTLAFEMSESSDILFITDSHPYECIPDCP